MFDISYVNALALSIPATFATAFGFIYGYGRVILSMARSGLFPPILVRTYGEYKTAGAAIIFGSVISYLVVILAFFVPIIVTYLFNVCILAGYTGYISQLVGFLLFRIRHPDQERKYISPLGITGAVYPIFIFTLCAISVIGFQNDSSFAFIMYIIFIAVATIYYYAYAKSRQFFSVEEKFIFILQIVKCKSTLLAQKNKFFCIIFLSFFFSFFFAFCLQLFILHFCILPYLFFYFFTFYF